MQIIDITNPREIPNLSHCYVAEPSAEVVAHEHHQRYGYAPDVLYRRVAANGMVSYYVPVSVGDETYLSAVR